MFPSLLLWHVSGLQGVKNGEKRGETRKVSSCFTTLNLRAWLRFACVARRCTASTGTCNRHSCHRREEDDPADDADHLGLMLSGELSRGIPGRTGPGCLGGVTGPRSVRSLKRSERLSPD